MTTVTAHISELVGRLAKSLRQAIETQAQSASRRGLIEKLEAKSDAELSQLGVKREEIGQYVFRDLFYA